MLHQRHEDLREEVPSSSKDLVLRCCALHCAHVVGMS